MKHLGGVVLAVIAIVVALIGVEAGLRLLPSDLLDGKEADQRSPFGFFRYDAKLGWENIPGATGKLVRREFTHEVHINSHGLRGPETSRAKPPGVRRVAVLGDSFTWGVGVSESEVYVSLVQEGLPGVEVLNFGVAGYSPVHYHMLTEKVLSFEPDVVVIAFCLGNDFIDNVHWRRYLHYKPFARLDETGAIVFDGYPLPYAKQHLHGERGQGFLERSYAYRLLDKAVLGRIRVLNDYGQKGLPLKSNGSDFYRTDPNPLVEQALRINAGLFKMIASAYAARGIPLLVLAAPTKCDMGRCFPDLTTPTDRALKHLRTSLSGLEIRLVGPPPDLTIDDFWQYDGHWRQSGHRKIADELIPALAETLKESQPR